METSIDQSPNENFPNLGLEIDILRGSRHGREMEIKYHVICPFHPEPLDRYMIHQSFAKRLLIHLLQISQSPNLPSSKLLHFLLSKFKPLEPPSSPK